MNHPCKMVKHDVRTSAMENFFLADLKAPSFGLKTVQKGPKTALSHCL